MKIEQGKRHWYVILEEGSKKFPTEQAAKEWAGAQDLVVEEEEEEEEDYGTSEEKEKKGLWR